MMPGHFPDEILARMRASGVAATFTVDLVEHGVPLAKALFAGGIDTIELVLRTPAAFEALGQICREVPELLVGVGTILNPEQAQAVKEVGAAFGVAPGFNPSVVDRSIALGLPFAPGIATPSELELAIEHGCRLVKFFPAERLGGLGYLRSMAAPYDHLGIEYIPLGGINGDNMAEYLNEPSVLAVGGTWIVGKSLVETENWAEIESRAAGVVRAIRGLDGRGR